MPQQVWIRQIGLQVFPPFLHKHLHLSCLTSNDFADSCFIKERFTYYDCDMLLSVPSYLKMNSITIPEYVSCRLFYYYKPNYILWTTLLCLLNKFPAALCWFVATFFFFFTFNKKNVKPNIGLMHSGFGVARLICLLGTIFNYFYVGYFYWFLKNITYFASWA